MNWFLLSFHKPPALFITADNPSPHEKKACQKLTVSLDYKTFVILYHGTLSFSMLIFYHSLLLGLLAFKSLDTKGFGQNFRRSLGISDRCDAVLKINRIKSNKLRN